MGKTDCVIHEGNSGGPLVNLDGEVVGINSVRANAHGISFAMRVDSAMPLIKQLAYEGRVVRPWLGMRIVSLTPALTSQLEQSDRDSLPDLAKLDGSGGGILVTAIFRGSPAHISGINAGDVICKVDNGPVHSTTEVNNNKGYLFLLIINRSF